MINGTLNALSTYPELAFALFALAVLLVQEHRIARLRQLHSPVAPQASAAVGESTPSAEKHLAMLLDCTRGISEALQRHQQQIRDLAARQEKLELQDPGLSRYREAVTLMRRGADQQELMSACGLSRGEAALVAHMNHLQRKAS